MAIHPIPSFFFLPASSIKTNNHNEGITEHENIEVMPPLSAGVQLTLPSQAVPTWVRR